MKDIDKNAVRADKAAGISFIALQQKYHLRGQDLKAILSETVPLPDVETDKFNKWAKDASRQMGEYKRPV